MSSCLFNCMCICFFFCLTHPRIFSSYHVLNSRISELTRKTKNNILCCDFDLLLLVLRYFPRSHEKGIIIRRYSNKIFLKGNKKKKKNASKVILTTVSCDEYRHSFAFSSTRNLC